MRYLDREVTELESPHPEKAGAGPAALLALREEIDEVDRELIDLISRRCQLARATGVEKCSAGLPLEDPAREARVVRLGASLARDRGLDEEGVRQILWCLIGLARRTQQFERAPTRKEGTGP